MIRKAAEMSGLDRTIVVLAGLFLCGVGVLMLGAAAGWDPAGLWSAWLAGGPRRLPFAIGALALLAAGLHLFFLGIATAREPGISKETDMGRIRISLRALENLVRRSCREIEGVRDVEARVHAQGDRVDVSVSVNVAPDVGIPAISEALQQEIGRCIRAAAGLEVGEIGVEVRNITGETPRPRVE